MKDTKKITAVGYLRVSGKDQTKEDKDGFPRQTESVTRCAESKGYTLLRCYEEQGVAGKLNEDHRPAFQEMVAELLNNGCRTIIVEAMHRLAREYRTQEHLIIYLASKGLTLISADTGEDITAAMMGDPMRKALVQIQGVFAELEKNLLVHKLAKARKRVKARDGRCEGVKPYGHRDGEQATLARMQELRAAGTAVDTIASILNGEGVPTRGRGGKQGLWYGATINKILKAAQQ
jgi:site-specific DNA recombinase